MASSLTWLDHDAAARERSLRILALFMEKESRDELGIGGIRDAISDRLFPGTSTIQTRLRYMLLIPWIYQRLEQQRVPTSQFAARARQDELAMVRPLLDAREKGVYGAVAGSGLKRLPSAVYWAGLGAWGIRRISGTGQDYSRAIDRLYARRARQASARDDRRDVEDRHADSATQTWHPKLPPPPDGFPERIDLRLTPDEAGFLIDRITAECSDSLLAWLALHGRRTDVSEPWLHPQLREFPEPLRVLLSHAKIFADLIEGAALLYNLCLAELAGNTGFATEHRSALQDWASRIDLNALKTWSLDAFWDQTVGYGHAITPATRHFVGAWVERVRHDAGRVADDAVARDLVRRREIALKGPRSRFTNLGARAQWSGAAGIGRLTYRWATARGLLGDLFSAMTASPS